MPTPMEEYLFDLHGYTVIKGALNPDHLRAMNDFLDALPPLQIDQWYGNIDVHTYSGNRWDEPAKYHRRRRDL